MKKQKLTKEQKEAIINSDLPNVELARIYDRSPKTISGIRIANGKGNKDKRGNFTVGPDKMKIILNRQLTVREAFEQSGISKKHIYTIRERNGILPPPKVKKPRVYKPRLKVEKPKLIKKQFPKLEKIKIEKPKKKPLPSVIKEAKKPKEHKEKVKLNAGMSHAEQEYLIRKKAQEIAKNNPLTEAQKIASGDYKWITRINKYNKTERVLTKILN